MDVSATIEVSALRAKYPGAVVPVIDHLDFCVSAGEALTILGPNGVGKSTLIRCLMGLMSPDSGQVLIGGRNVQSMTYVERAQHMSLVSQSEQSVFALSVQEVVLTGRAAYLGMFGGPGKKDRVLAAKALEVMGIADLSERSFAQLSGGQRQLVRIARALTQESKIMVLDEPTAHLDLANQMQVLKAVGLLLQQGITVVMTSHDPVHAFVCGGSVLLMGKDHKSFGPVETIITNEALSKIYSVPLTMIMSAHGEMAVAPNYSEFMPDQSVERKV